MKDKSKAMKVTIGILAAFVVIVAAIYLAASFYFRTHYYSGSIINGIDCTGKTVEDVRAIMNDELKEYKLEIKGRSDLTATITGKDINLTYVDDNTLTKLLEDQNPYLWFTAFSNKKDYAMTANTEYDEALLTSVVDSMSFFKEENVVAPVDAHMQENESNYEVVPEVLGNTLDKEKVLTLVKTAIDESKKDLDLEAEDCYVKPAVYSDNEALVNEVNTLNTFISANITIPFGDRQEVVDPAQIKQWLVIGEDNSVSLDEAAVAAYVKHLAYVYDTFGLDHQFTTHAGNTITVKGGDYGWAMNRDVTTQELIAAIKVGGTQEFQPTYRYKGMSRDANDIGGTYVEVSLSEQRMWCYKDGQQIVDTPIVTGLPTPDRVTLTGIYAIDAKKQDATLGKKEVQGYSSPVKYWMPFNGGQGIHDADGWRDATEYGGTTYTTNGSHGCVNTPYENAKKIYEAVEIGTAVIVY